MGTQSVTAQVPARWLPQICPSRKDVVCRPRSAALARSCAKSQSCIMVRRPKYEPARRHTSTLHNRYPHTTEHPLAALPGTHPAIVAKTD
jgi:hypothetical protein